MIAVVILVVGALVAIGLWSWLAQRAGSHGPRGAGGRSPGGGGAMPGLRSARAIVEEREALEAEDLAQMLEAHNAWRRRRGRPERAMEDVERLVARDREEVRRTGPGENGG
ncbi:MAG: hypothetical protein ACRDK8_08100 [Solirubrobacteraceae bacterium]